MEGVAEGSVARPAEAAAISSCVLRLVAAHPRLITAPPRRVQANVSPHILVYACSPLPTLLQYTSSMRAHALLCPHDGVYMGVIAPAPGLRFPAHHRAPTCYAFICRGNPDLISWVRAVA